MSRPGDLKPKNRATNNLRNGLVAQVAGGLFFGFELPRRIELDVKSCGRKTVVGQIDLALIQSHLITPTRLASR